MAETLIRKTVGSVTIRITQDVLDWNNDELLNAARELDELIISLETGEPIILFTMATRRGGM